MKTISRYVLDFVKRADMLLFSLSFISAILGIFIISSATASYSDQARHIVMQVSSLLIGIFLFVLFTVIDIDIIADKWPILAVFSVVFILSLLIWGEDRNGNRGWLNIFGLSLQPTEIVKYVFIVMLAKHIYYLKSYKDLNSVFSISQLVLHFILMFGLVIGVARDLGSATIFMFIFIVMIYIAGVKLYWFAAGIALIAIASPLLWTNFLSDYQRQRILAPYDPSVDPNNDGVRWQTVNSLRALGSGQLKGTGLYNGPQSQSDAIPEKHTDFIFAVAGEELGMIGCCIILLLLILIIIRCVYVGLHSRNTMNMLVCFGVAATIFLQTFENIGMCIGLTPVVGLTLPFFSYGGSSLFSTFAAMGIVSGVMYRPKPEKFHKIV